MKAEEQLRINLGRLIRNLEALGEIGRNSDGGIDRAFGSRADLQAREWLTGYWNRELHADTRVDAIANLWVTYPGREALPPIVIGSHHDAVPDGGKYDGALGVLLATEIVQRLMEEQIVLRHPLAILSFTAEEPNPFNLSTLGSKVVSGRLTAEDLTACRSRLNGESLEAAIARVGGYLPHAEQARLEPGRTAAFLECHIEQGKRLEQMHQATAVVSRITGIHREQYTVFGEANHAGTTRMNDRRDAFLAAAELALAIEREAAAFQDDQIAATTGYLQLAPNEANIIPGKAVLLADVRISDAEKLAQLTGEIIRTIAELERSRGVRIERAVILEQQPAPMDDLVMRCVAAGIERVGEKPVELVSMAGHDAANMTRITRSGMIFVKSVDGKSHCRQEYSRPEDVEKAGNAMLQAVLYLDKELTK